MRTPCPCCFTARLCVRIQARAALLTCQEAVSQISAPTGTPSAASLRQHQFRNWVVIALPGRPPPKRGQIQRPHNGGVAEVEGAAVHQRAYLLGALAWEGRWWRGVWT